MTSSYALVRITNNATKHVIYAETHNPQHHGRRDRDEDCIDQFRCAENRQRLAPAVWWLLPTASFCSGQCDGAVEERSRLGYNATSLVLLRIGEVAFCSFINFFGSRVFVRSDLVGSDEEGSG